MSRESAADVNREYYGALSAGREDYWKKMAAPRFRVQTFLRLLEREPPANLVDLGCGNGALLGEIGRRLPGIFLAGIDLSATQIEANERRVPSVFWRAFDLAGTDPPAADLAGRFEAVVASELIEHLESPEAFLRTAASLAAPGRGRLLLSTQSGPVRETERRVGHRRHFEAGEMRRLLSETGWEPELVWNAGFPFHDLSKWLANRRPQAALEAFGGGRYGLPQDLVCYALRVAFCFNSSRRGAQLFAVARRR